MIECIINLQEKATEEKAGGKPGGGGTYKKG